MEMRSIKQAVGGIYPLKDTISLTCVFLGFIAAAPLGSSSFLSLASIITRTRGS